MDMVIKELKNKIVPLLLLFLFFSCQKKEDLITIINSSHNLHQIENYTDEADVCKMKKYQLQQADIKSFVLTYNKIDKKHIFPESISSDWTTVGWQENNIDKRIIDFIAPNFRKSNLENLISKNQYFYSYSYNGKIDDLFAIKLYLLIPKQKELYYFEILP